MIGNLKNIKIGAPIWIRSGRGSHEEPGTLLAINIHMDKSEDEDEHKFKKSSNTDVEDEKTNDGVLVQLNTSNSEILVHKDCIRSMIDDTNDGVRRSRRCKTKKKDSPLAQTKHITKISSTPNTTSVESHKENSDDPINNNKVKKSNRAQQKGQKSRNNKRKTIENEEKKLENLGQRKKCKANNKIIVSEEVKIVPRSQKENRKDVSARKTQNGGGSDKTNKNEVSVAKGKKKSATKITDRKKQKRATKKSVESNMDSLNADENQENVVSLNGQPDGNGGLDQPSNYGVEYSPTSRAMCRRCDERIEKQCLRVSHRPLFRGKPGFTIYRHLNCIVFGPEITNYLQVDGHHKLKPDDIELLKKRILESEVERKQEMEELRPDELVQKTFQGEIRPHPPGLTANLLPFQVEGFSWMVAQEKRDRGGILADEMGMGKTIQTICTLLDNRPNLQHAKPGAKFPPDADRSVLQEEEDLWDFADKDWKHEMNMQNVPLKIQPNKGKHSDRAGTLVVCPMIALHQWKTEIQKFTSEDGATLSVGIYHGPDRASMMPKIKMKMYDVVLTTYQVLEQDMRKMISPNKVRCPNCGGKFKIDKLRIHLKYFCGEGAQRTEAQSRQRRGRGHRGNRPGTSRSRGIGQSQGKRKKKVKNEKKSFKKKKNNEKEEESDSDSQPDDKQLKELISKRPSRKAASAASKVLSTSMKNWSAGGNDDDEDFESPNDDSDEDTDLSEIDDELVSTSMKGKKETVVKSNSCRMTDEDVDYNSNCSDSEMSESDDEGRRIAIEKQRQAIENATNSKGKRKSFGKIKNKKKLRIKKEKKAVKSTIEELDDELGINMGALLEEAMAGSHMSSLHSLSWWRVVLDEAHMIKTRSSQTAQAAFALTAIYRWCLSGTPLQNRVGEFYSLIRFLRIDPMAHYFCRSKGSDCKSLHYRMAFGKCLDCGHASSQHYSYFNRYVLNPIQRDGYSGDGRRAMFILKNEVLDKYLLRRTKESRAEDMNLPPRIVSIRRVRLHPIEEDFYNALYTQTRSSFSDYVADGTLLNNYAHIFDLLMRMRQSVDHPYLIVYSQRGVDESLSASLNDGNVANGSTNCEICHEIPDTRVLSSCCNSAFCKSCVIEYMATAAGLGATRDGVGTPCPSCRQPFSIDLNQAESITPLSNSSRDKKCQNVQETKAMPSLKALPNVATKSILRRIDLSKFATSSKIEALTEELVKMRQTSPGSKAIVFSQFVNMLDLIRWRIHSDPCLEEMGLGARALHGSMDVKARNLSLKDFREDCNVRVLLVSLKAGGVALNLTVANHIYLMDPWWNPAAEMQAIDRTHRLGQYRPIRAVRFIAENTVEERILQLQEKKRLVFDGTVGRDAGSLTMLTVDDMKSLFS